MKNIRPAASAREAAMLGLAVRIGGRKNRLGLAYAEPVPLALDAPRPEARDGE